MTSYYINEAILWFSGDVIQDSTINMLRLSDPDAALIVSRGQMHIEDELSAQVEQQMKKLEKQVKDLRYTPAKKVLLGINQQTEGLEIHSQFLRGHESVCQCQVAFVLPGSRIMMAVTYARAAALTDIDITRWEEIKKNLRFRMTPDTNIVE
ncbi:DcrB-related protein [Superficieibacter sp. HKU1]|uniref:DcrB-related protein n=1 Tax=Superficieibacter sp. HKU1 TaxID=3031919 RepID=UPI0023E19E14|nr:DcrB-related protein [Superficieibacter sp. HKU1]WES69441.1 DcrB-related protein [Superficieibacter sp. HKU1]